MLSELDMLSAIDVSFAIGFYFPERDVIRIIIRERIATQHRLIRAALRFQAPGPKQIFALPPAWFPNPGHPEILQAFFWVRYQGCLPGQKKALSNCLFDL